MRYCGVLCLILLASFASGCDSVAGRDKRISAGAFAGASLGAFGGPIGAGVGFGAGAVVGALVPEDAFKVNNEQ